MSDVHPGPVPHPEAQVPPTLEEKKKAIVDDTPSLPRDIDDSLVLPTNDLLPPDATPPTSRTEIWSYYAYYIGANGLSLFNFGPTAFQNLLSQAAPQDTGLLPFAGRERDVNSIVLLANGISFACQAVLFLCIGAYADFGTGRRWVLVFWSVVAFAVGFAWLGVHDPSRWKAGAALYVLGLVAYQLTLTYWTAAFPALARGLPAMREARARVAEGGMTGREFARLDERERSRLANVAFYVQSVGEVVILAVIVGIMFALHVNDGTEQNNWGLSVLVAFATACWVALSLPWFVLEKTRPGLKVPAGMNLVSVGFWQLYEAMTKIWHLKQSLVYLVGYFLLGDSLNTTVTVIGTLQNQVVSYDTLTLTYLLIVGIVAQAVGIGLFWLLQKRFDLSAKTMFNAVMVGILLLDGWGMVGNWTDKFGFHNVWEIWLYQAFYGLFVCPWYSYSQILISSVTPPGHEFLFFSLFSIIGKTSSFIGPLVSSAIIDATPDQSGNSAPFYFLFALSFVSAAFIWFFLDLEKSAVEQQQFLEQEKARILGVNE
ncbi:Autophagy-related protein [Coniochaeta hoffmannii]|uniref:Autophagy-related protein n=1 Tax=Coniochaeta hoffmannii TaxID=91930 RepID=A0AA38R2I1_9PEZI|nr:Autophagy-related protein [Coniochaeta hoffmannii]